MKAKSITLSLLLASALFLFNCSGEKKEESHEEHADNSAAPAETTSPTFTVDAEFQKQLSGVFAAYVSMKDAFVASDAAKVKTEATATLDALSKTDMKLLSGAAHNDWMNYLGNLEGSLRLIESSSDIEEQRQNFSMLSGNLYKAIKAYGLGGVTAYYEFCPMAFDNQGAYWLSMEEKIRNPYFGDKMLTCGSVKETVR
jgi:Cu(I)/Ag(I) efflux system membrane fusion protein